jgi:hypothetical protein
VFQRGDPTRAKKEVTAGLPEVLVDREPPPPHPRLRSTGRRLWLAHWLTDPHNPLTARVMVNRVWQGHFGRGLVATPNDFGVMGEPPTHPDLLDWLSSRFVDDGWSMKALHRLIVLSNTYQQSASIADCGLRIADSKRDDPQSAIRNPQSVDPKNSLLWRWPQYRLQAEAVRDSMLAVSGTLNPQRGGPSFYPTLPRAVLEGQSRPGDGWGKSDLREQHRRSIYIFVKRSLAVPELDLLDAPDTTSSCETRPVSTTAPQALTFLNGAFTNEMARHLAVRLQREVGNERAEQVRVAFSWTMCRLPTDQELQWCLGFLRQFDPARPTTADPGKQGGRALESLCLVLLNSSEFSFLN